MKTSLQGQIDLGGGGGKRHPTGKFLKPTFLAQLWGADFENLCYMAI